MTASRDPWKSYFEAYSHFRVSRDRISWGVLSSGIIYKSDFSIFHPLWLSHKFSIVLVSCIFENKIFKKSGFEKTFSMFASVDINAGKYIECMGADVLCHLSSFVRGNGISHSWLYQSWSILDYCTHEDKCHIYADHKYPVSFPTRNLDQSEQKAVIWKSRTL